MASANGFAGTVANAATTPAVTLETTVTGLLKGNGTAVSAAVSGTDYDAAGAAAAAAAASLPLSGGTMSGSIAMGGTHKITGLASGTASTDAAAFGQIPAGVFNVQAYGAALNGTTDDTAAWAAAVSACSSAGGGTVTFTGNSLIDGSGGVGVTVPANVQISGGMTTAQLSTATPGRSNIIIGSNSLTALFNVTGNSVAISGFTVTAANSGCAVPVISAQGRARQYYRDIYATGCGGMYLESLSRSRIENCYVQNCNSGYGYYLHNQSLVYCRDLNAGPNGDPAYASLSGVTLTSGITASATVTSLSVSALSADLAAGSVLVLGALTGNIETAVLSAAASSGATTLSVVSFTALNTISSGQPVQQYTMGYVITGGTCKQWNCNSSAGWAYPKFIFNQGNSYYEDIETNESGQNGVDSLYLNNVQWCTFSGFNNNTGLFNGYQVNMVNGCNFISLTGGGILGGGLARAWPASSASTARSRPLRTSASTACTGIAPERRRARR